MCSTLSLGFPNVAFETVAMFVCLMLVLSCSSKDASNTKLLVWRSNELLLVWRNNQLFKQWINTHHVPMCCYFGKKKYSSPCPLVLLVIPLTTSLHAVSLKNELLHTLPHILLVWRLKYSSYCFTLKNEILHTMSLFRQFQEWNTTYSSPCSVNLKDEIPHTRPLVPLAWRTKYHPLCPLA